jgi:hypothetical protein
MHTLPQKVSAEAAPPTTWVRLERLAMTSRRNLSFFFIISASCGENGNRARRLWAMASIASSIASLAW